jgi:hypothetical protein
MTFYASIVTIQIAAWMFELLATGRQLQQFVAAALREDRVAGIAIVSLDGQFFILGFVQTVVTAEAAEPDYYVFLSFA